MSAFQQSEFDRLQTNFNTFQEDSDDDDEPPPPSYQQGNFNDYEASTPSVSSIRILFQEVTLGSLPMVEPEAS